MIIPDIRIVTESVARVGFSCTGCACCCTEIEPGSNIVMVNRQEIREITRTTGMMHDEIAEPYPGRITCGEQTFTFGWAIRRAEGRCIFLHGNRCAIYESRPWICRTYPFMISGATVVLSECQGAGTVVPTPGAEDIAADLIARALAEAEEEDKIEEIMQKIQIPSGKSVVIDSEGMVEING